MKTTLIWVVAMLSVSCAGAADKPEGKITFKITDESGTPLRGVSVQMITLDEVKPGSGFGDSTYKQTAVITDDQGLAQITATSRNPEFSYRIWEVPGYYRKGGAYLFTNSANGRWEPWNPMVQLLLKPILHPVPMYAKKVEALPVPEIGKPVGYDLMVGDWVAPYGRGHVRDFLFTLTREFTGVREHFDATLTVTFSNDDDGIQSIIAKPVVTELRLPYAPESGYESQLVKRTYRKSRETPIETGIRKDQNYFFRVRTRKVDDKIVSTLYGKIYGDIEFWPNGKIRFEYFLNPEPNSRNMEFDPKRNLLKNITRLEQVNQP